MAKNVREEILKILAKPTTVTELKNKIKGVRSFGTLAYHLKNLESEGIITKNEKKKGEQIRYSLMDKRISKLLEKLKEKEKEAKIIILKKLKENPLMSDQELERYLEQSILDEKELPHVIDQIFGCSNENLATLHFKITPKGLKFLEQNSSE
jgi:DNA-binding HxlR family transcriptional regulator